MKNVKVLRSLVFVQSAVILLLLAYIVFGEKLKSKSTIAVHAEVCADAPVDFGIWHGELTVRRNDLVLAYDELERNRERMLRNFTAKGLLASDIEFKGIQNLGDSNNVVLTQKVVVSSRDLSRFKKVVSESGELLKFRVDFSAEEPHYRIANFTIWLTSQLPKLIDNAKQQANALLQNGQEITSIKSFKMKPVSAKNNGMCIPFGTPLDVKEMHVLLEAEIEFMVR